MTLRFANKAEFDAWMGRRKPPAASKPVAQPKSRMNKTEAAWATRLEAQKRAGDVRDYRFEEIKLRLADRAWYTPDFLVIHSDGSVEFQEIKGGFIREDGLLKFKIAREQFSMFRWSLWQRNRTQWLKVK